MKVTPSMYGRPAKCVACHQKWFVPTREEIPAEVRFVHLRDHPDLLRESGQLARTPGKPLPEEPQASSPADTPAPEFSPDEAGAGVCSDSGQVAGALRGRDASSQPPAGASEHPPMPEIPGSDTPAPIPEGELEYASGENVAGKTPEPVVKPCVKCAVDDLPALRLLCSYQHALDDWKRAQNDKDAVHPAENAIRQAREDLSNRLRMEQAQAASRLAALEEAIGGVTLRLRTGEITPKVFLQQATELREQREVLTRLLHNLAAWMHATGPVSAGGLIKVVPENFKADAYSLDLPAAIGSEQAVPSGLGDALRESLRMRAGAERKIAEWRQMAADGVVPSDVAQEGQAAAEAECRRALDRIRFFQGRLECLRQDCNHDLRALEAFREEARSRARHGEIPFSALRVLDAEIQEVCTDTLRLRSIINRRLIANAAAEVTTISDTLLQRLRGWHRASGLHTDLIPAILGALAIGAGGIVALNRGWDSPLWMHILVLMLPFALVILAAWPRDSRRNKALTLYCALQTVLIGWHVVQARAAGPVFLEPAGVFLLLGLFFGGTVAGISWTGDALFAQWQPAAKTLAALVFSGMSVAAVMAADAAFTSDVMPPLLPLTDDTPAPVSEAIPGLANTEGTAESSEWGGDAASASETPPMDSGFAAVAAPGDVPAPEDPGTGPAADTPPQAEASEFVADSETLDSGSSVGPGPAMAYFELHGVIHSEGLTPRFRATLHAPNGMVQPLALDLNQPIYGAWKTHEYHVETKRLTLYNGERFLILQAGDAVHLDDTAAAEPL